MKKLEEAKSKPKDSELKTRQYLKKVLGIDKVWPEQGWEEARLKQRIFTTGVSCSCGR
jgi:hypothetical protein